MLGRQVGADLIQVVGDCDAAAVDECLQAGLLVDDGRHQAFRHDPSRQAVDESMTPLRRRQLHARALEALGEDGDVVQRAHHAVGAGDRDAIVDLAWRAADQCVALGAWRQAALLYGQAVEHTRHLLSEDRRRLLEAQATTCLRVEMIDEAVKAGEAAHALIAATGDETALAAWEGWMSRAYRAAGLITAAWDAAHQAVERMEPFGESPALAEALASLSGHQLVTGQFADCVSTAQRAFEMAERLELEPTAIYALNSYGAALGGIGDPETGLPALRDSLERSKRAGLAEHASRAYTNLAFAFLSSYQPALALPVLDEGIAAAEQNELRWQVNCMYPSRAEVRMLLGEWDDAIPDLTTVLADPGASGFSRASVLLLLGRIRARRGDPNPFELLDEALTLAALRGGPAPCPRPPCPGRGGLAGGRPAPGRRRGFGHHALRTGA